MKIGLIIGAIWGLLSTVIFVTVGTFGSPTHPNHWLFVSFQASIEKLWFKILFLPFLSLVEILSSSQTFVAYAVFASTPFGAIIGLVTGVITSVISYLIRK